MYFRSSTNFVNVIRDDLIKTFLGLCGCTCTLLYTPMCIFFVENLPRGVDARCVGRQTQAGNTRQSCTQSATDHAPSSALVTID